MKRESLAKGLLACWLIKKCGASDTGSLSNTEMEMTNNGNDDDDDDDDDDTSSTCLPGHIYQSLYQPI